jgi:serine/threonine protein kinase
LGKKFGQGTFGAVLAAYDEDEIKDVSLPDKNLTPYVIKLSEWEDRHELELEHTIYEMFKQDQTPRIPYVNTQNDFGQCRYHSFRLNKRIKHAYLIMEMLGPNLEEIQNAVHPYRLPPDAICTIAYQLIPTLQALHKRGYIHADLKPENIALGRLRTSTETNVYLVDFGLAIQYNQRRTDTTMGDGTPLYSSIHIDNIAYPMCPDTDLSPRNDLESLAYTLIHLALGRLPWDTPGEDLDDMYYRKATISRDELLNNGLIPEPLREFTRNVLDLGPDEQIDYEALQNLFSERESVLSIAEVQYDYAATKIETNDRGIVVYETSVGNAKVPGHQKDLQTRKGLRKTRHTASEREKRRRELLRLSSWSASSPSSLSSPLSSDLNNTNIVFTSRLENKLSQQFRQACQVSLSKRSRAYPVTYMNE